jgi:Siphovirus ReqiPepy6 Gp37-like protein
VDLYTLDEAFLPQDPISEYVSAIWTERYSSAGEVQIVVPLTPENLVKLQPGVYLALLGSREVMELQSFSFENNLVTIIGTSLTSAILNRRVLWFNTNIPGGKAYRYSANGKAGPVISYVVDRTVIHPLNLGGTGGSNLLWEADIIPELQLGPIDNTGTVQLMEFQSGPLYDGIEPIAKQFGVGILLYVESADPVDGYELKFTTYRGKDRTSNQTVNDIVRLTPDLDSLTGVKELRSIANYKNICYVYHETTGIITTHYEDPAHIPEGMDRRTIVADVPDNGNRDQVARDALANHNYVKAIDGEISPVNQYIYGTDYGLGDVIELQGLTGVISQARVTEYIRSEDATGEKAYPTISVVGEES